MSFRMLRPIGLAAGSAILLAGCTTGRYAPRYSYYRVPCTTPGAVLAQPIGLEVSPPASAMPAVPSGVPVANVADTAATCVVAVSAADYRRAYYPGGYYGRPYYGSFGLGLGFGGGHFGGGHFGGGHFGGGHFGGHGGGHSGGHH